MLHGVQVQIARRQRGVGLHVVVEFDHLQINAFLGGQGLDLLHHQRVGAGRDADFELDVLGLGRASEGEGVGGGQQGADESAFLQLDYGRVSFEGQGGRRRGERRGEAPDSSKKRANSGPSKRALKIAPNDDSATSSHTMTETEITRWG